ncbi:MAG: hypothetical protein ACRCTQ_00920 [Brevinemataceae bacterium]
MKKWFVVFLLTLNSCQNKKLLQYQNIFDTSLGTNITQIGSYFNVNTLKEGYCLEANFVVPNALYVYNQKLYVADQFNQRISIFPISKQFSAKDVIVISNKTSEYSFAQPYNVLANNKFIYSVVSTKEIDYSNNSNFNSEDLFIYKFTSKGQFVYSLGKAGKNSQVLDQLPNHLYMDLEDNLYVYYWKYHQEKQLPYFEINKYNDQGILIQTFDTITLFNTTNISGTNYQPLVSSALHNPNGDLVMTIELQPITDTTGNEIIPEIQNIKNYTAIYSVSTKEFIRASDLHGMDETILGISDSEDIYLQSFDTEQEILQIKVLSSSLEKKSQFYVPVKSDYYLINNYFIDHIGNIYNSVIDRCQKFILIKWNKK